MTHEERKRALERYEVRLTMLLRGIEALKEDPYDWDTAADLLSEIRDDAGVAFELAFDLYVDDK